MATITDAKLKNSDPSKLKFSSHISFKDIWIPKNLIYPRYIYCPWFFPWSHLWFQFSINTIQKIWFWKKSKIIRWSSYSTTITDILFKNLDPSEFIFSMCLIQRYMDLRESDFFQVYFFQPFFRLIGRRQQI